MTRCAVAGPRVEARFDGRLGIRRDRMGHSAGVALSVEGGRHRSIGRTAYGAVPRVFHAARC